MDITATHPGGNILVESIRGDTVRLRQDPRDTIGWWFYWNFRVTGAAGRTLRFEFTNQNVFAALGPCYSAAGRPWAWLGTDGVDGDAFRHSFGRRGSAWFAFCIPYLERDLRAFLARRPRIQVATLTRSEHGRRVERLVLRSRRGTFMVPLVARSHACESMANYVLEGILDAWLDATPESAFLQEHVDLQAIPFLDKDGVEEGDQGKNRAPHDHNRDFRPHAVWKSPRAFMQQVAAWRGAVRMSLDLHCPWIRGGRNEEIYFVGSPGRQQRKADRFAVVLEESQTGPLRYRAENNLPFGQEWNTSRGAMFARYMRKAYPTAFSSTLKFPYALAGGQTVALDGARGFGRDLARAIALYHQA